MPRHNHHHHGHGHGTIDGRASGWYNFLSKSFRRLAYRRIAKDVARSAPRSGAVLDIGTGPGVMLVELHRFRPDLELTGVDLSADMVAHAKRNLGERAAVRLADVAELPFEAERFDLVVASFSAHHWEDPAAGAAEIARVLRPGGRLLIYDFEHAPYDAIAGQSRLDDVSRGPFHVGLGRLMRSQRFEATATTGTQRS
ncbi:class I SAM-dependent methyltransferase [Glycomyces arizonensis]|uniref:class I SAM-dependent methyltransferase n=1 Tax=Glycomyces arizonensis TaxID=256035 RepID=UPI000405E45D|nr:class I SAM-dependent methyltransferase [Glycomyces arizonensis]